MQIKCAVCGLLFKTNQARFNKTQVPCCSRKCSVKTRRQIPIEIRLWKHVLKTESCWLWTGARSSKTDRGTIRYANQKGRRPYQISWEIAHGPIPKGMCVCHNCPGGDNPNCVNPAHLFLSNHAGNMIDGAKKGQMNKKLTIEQVHEIRRLGETAMMRVEIARQFGINRSTLWSILTGRVRKYI